MIRMLLLLVAASFLFAGSAWADSPTAEPQDEAVAEAKAKGDEARPEKVRLSTHDRWRGRPYLSTSGIRDPRDVQLPRMNQPASSGRFSAEGTAELRNEALNKRLPLPHPMGSVYPF